MATETLPTVEISPGNPAHLIEIAVTKGVDLDYLKELLALKREWEKDEARKAYFTAFAGFKADAPSLVKDALVDFTAKSGHRTRYAYDTVGQLTALIGGALAKHGLSHSFDIDQQDDGKIHVTCILSHEGGHSETVTLKAGPDDKTGMSEAQAISSTITSLKRATLKAVTGLDPEEDASRPVTVPHTTSPKEVNPLEAGTLYEGKITVCEQKKSGKGGTIRVQTDLGEVEMGFWSRPGCMQDMPPKDWHKMEKQPCVFSFTAKESNGRIYRNVETLDIVGVEVKQ